MCCNLCYIYNTNCNGTAQAQHVKAIEATIRHDVKAVEYYLKARLQGTTLDNLRGLITVGS